MTCANFISICPCSIERLYCYGKARSFFFPTYDQFLIFAQLVDHHAFDSAKIFINRTNDDFLTFYYIVLEKLVESDSSYADLLAYTKNKITSAFLDYYRKGVRS